MHNTAKRGFTLIEVLVAMSILMLIVLMMSTLFHQSSMAWNNGMRQAEMSIQARAAMSMIRKDLSQAVAADGLNGALKCSFNNSGFTVPVMSKANENTRSVEQVSYSFGGNSINRYSRELKSNNSVGVYSSNGIKTGGKLLDHVTAFGIKVPGNFNNYTTNLPPWVDVTLTLEKTTIGAAGIKIWSLGRNIDNADERIRRAKKNRLYTGDAGSIQWK